MNKQEVALLSEEIEMLMQEREMLLKVAGAAAALISHADVQDLSEEVVADANKLSRLINKLPEDTLKDALESAQAD